MPAVFGRQELLHRNPDMGLVAGENHDRAGGKIGQHLPADAAGGDHLAILVLLPRPWVADRDDGIDALFAAGHGLAQGHSLGADRGPPDLRIQVQAGIDPARGAPDRAGNVVAVLHVALFDQALGGVDQGLIPGGDGDCSDWLVHDPMLRCERSAVKPKPKVTI